MGRGRGRGAGRSVGLPAGAGLWAGGEGLRPVRACIPAAERVTARNADGGGPLSPVRTCIGCRTRRRSAEMRRVRLDAGGALVFGPGPGRGAWLCDDIDCLNAATRRRVFGRALRADVKPSEIARLREAWPLPPGDALGRSSRVGTS